MYVLTEDCKKCVRKYILGNCILISSVSRVDSIAVSKIWSVGKSHIFTQLA